MAIADDDRTGISLLQEVKLQAEVLRIGIPKALLHG